MAEPFPMAVKVARTPDVADLDVEIDAIARLHHPGVVRLYDQGVHEGRAFLAMELAEATLAARVPGSWPEVLDLVEQLLDALAHTHARGLVHRDLKASNVLARPRASGGTRWILTDFGIAHQQGQGQGHAAATSGTPITMAPEQFEGRWTEIGPPTDLYGLACLVWEVVTGAPPWRGSPMEVALAHLTEPVPAFRPRLAVPAGLEAWLRRLLQKQPEDRLEMAADARAALQGIDDDPVHAPWAAAGPLDEPPTIADLPETWVPRAPAAARPAAW